MTVTTTSNPSAPIGPIQRRLLAEDLVRLRRSDEQRRYAACQRHGRIDPNPHQIDAVMFALRRIPEGGCILADEVGLGKTIEAGLIISQVLAEGMKRVLLIVPKSLLGQWQTELYSLFGIEAREGQLDPDAFAGSGVFLAHRELAGGTKGASVLKAADPFDLVVVDEAHEVFSSIHKRYDEGGAYKEDSKQARTAGRVREVIQRGRSPVILLTATPIQNSLAELWGLVQYVEPTGTLLGRLPTFRKVFCESGDRSVLPEQAVELRRRLQTVLQRTLRRQAQEFLQVPFVDRRSKVFKYEMSSDEKALYDDVTAWLMREDLLAFRGSQRHLLLISFHRRMASSLAALSVSLQRVAQRLRDRLQRLGYTASDDGSELLREMTDDLEDAQDDAEVLEEDDAVVQQEVAPATTTASEERLRAELQIVEGFVTRSRALGHDSKARCLLDALRLVRERGESGAGAGKAVIFTESLTTQEYLRDLLLEHGYQPSDITLFRGHNDTPDAFRALERWETEVGQTTSQAHRPSREIALRLALVHEFAHVSRVFISTEAGAKGLNLQFCDTVINYDLPWNPQRIEQRIGRVHRYGQTRGVTVISFLAAGNEAQRLTLEILEQKLELFGRVLDQSDVVLYEPSNNTPESLVASVSADFEKELRAIYSRARSLDEVSADLRHLRDTIEARRQAFDEVQGRASGLIESRLDGTVRQVLANYQSALPRELEGLDRDVDRVVSAYFYGRRVPVERSHEAGRVTYRVPAHDALPPGYQDGLTLIVGDARGLEQGEPLTIRHPIVQAAVDDARSSTAEPMRVVLELPSSVAHSGLGNLAGRAGRIAVSKACYRGIENADDLLAVATVEGDADPLPPGLVDGLLSLPVLEWQPAAHLPDDLLLNDAVDEALVLDVARVSAREQAQFDQMLRQLEHYLADQVVVLRRRLAALDSDIEQLERKREKTVGSQAADAGRQLADRRRSHAQLKAQIEALSSGGDEEYRAWRDRLYSRRFRKPEVERILDLEFTVVSGAAAC